MVCTILENPGVWNAKGSGQNNITRKILNYEFRWSGRWQVYFDQMPNRLLKMPWDIPVIPSTRTIQTYFLLPAV